MVLFNYSTKELTAKIVYYGPGLCGKTTNLQFIYDSLPEGKKGKMLSLATQTDRTLYFDFLPVELGDIRGLKTRVQLYTVPGQVFYNETRKMVLKGVDGVVFVADSQAQMSDANLESFGNLEENLRVHGLDPATIPLVLQFNKRDLPSTVAVEEMNAKLNHLNAPFYEAIATTGIGVHDTLKAITKLVLLSLSERYGDEQAGARREGTSPPAPPMPPPQPPRAAVAAPVAAWQTDDLDLELDRMDAIEIEGLLEEVEAFDRAPQPRSVPGARPALAPLRSDFEFGLPEEDVPSVPAAAERSALALDDDALPAIVAEESPTAESDDWRDWRPEGGSVLPDDLDEADPLSSALQEESVQPAQPGDLFVPLAETPPAPAWERPEPAPPAPVLEPPLAAVPAVLIDGGMLRVPLRLEIGGRTVNRILTVRLEPEHDSDHPRS